MPDITAIKHPLISHLGRTQAERLSQALDPSTIQIDGRSRIDIIDLIYRLSRQVNFYDEQLNIGDWRPFFEDSLPFLLARIHKIDTDKLEDGFHEIAQLVQDQPLKNNLRLLFDYLFTEVIQPINTAMIRFNELENSFGLLINSLVGGNLQGPMEDYIALYNAANHWFCIGKRSFFEFQEQEAWKLDFRDLFAKDERFRKVPGGFAARIKNLIDRLEEILQQFLGILKQLGQQAPNYLEESLRPLQEKYQEKHHPQLGLFFSFLELFALFQQQLNQLSEAQLNFFFLKVLQVQQRATVPDKAHLVFEIQKQLDHFLLEKGTRFKDGKDLNNKDVFYQLDSEILIDKTQVTTLRTLFLKHVQGNVSGMASTRFVEGIYIAPDATKADGIDQDFPAEGPNSWPTLGNKYSKYIEPATPPSLEPKAYPVGRTGFVFASSILLLNEGKRKIRFFITLENPEYCGTGRNKDISNLFSAEKFEDFWMEEVCCRLDQVLVDKIQTEILSPFFSSENPDNPNTVAYQLKQLAEELGFNFEDVLVVGEQSENEGLNALREFYQAIQLYQHRLEVFFPALLSGCKHDFRLYCYSGTGTGDSFLSISDSLNMFQAAIPFQLLEDSFDTDTAAIVQDFIEQQLSLPLEVVLEENCHIRLRPQSDEPLFLVDFSGAEMWLRPTPENVSISFSYMNDQIDLLVEVYLEDTFPAVTFYNKEVLLELFDTTSPVAKFCLNPKFYFPCQTENFEVTCQLEACSSQSQVDISLYHFLRYLEVTDVCIDVEVCGVRNMVVQNDENIQDVNQLVYPFGVRPTIENNPFDYFVGDNDLKGSNFYIGSKEVLLKKWEKIWINLNWKDKPASLTQHYIGYEDITQGVPEIFEDNFKVKLSVLENQSWKKEERGLPFVELMPAEPNPYTDSFPGEPNKDKKFRKLFRSSDPLLPICTPSLITYEQRFQIERKYFGLSDRGKDIDMTPLEKLDVNTRDGFLRFTLQCEYFHHDRYSFVLSRQMLAYSKFPTDYLYGAVYSYFDTEAEEFDTITSLKDFEDFIQRPLFNIEDLSRTDFDVSSIADSLKDKNSGIVTAIKNREGDSIVEDLREDLCEAIFELIDTGTSADLDGVIESCVQAAFERIGIEIDESIVDLFKAALSEVFTSTQLGNLVDAAVSNIVSLIENTISENGLKEDIKSEISLIFDQVFPLEVLAGPENRIRNELNVIGIDVSGAAATDIIKQALERLRNTVRTNFNNLLDDKAQEIVDIIITYITPDPTDPAHPGSILEEGIRGEINSIFSSSNLDPAIEGAAENLKTGVSAVLDEDTLRAAVQSEFTQKIGELVLPEAQKERLQTEIDSIFSGEPYENNFVFVTEELDRDACGISNEEITILLEDPELDPTDRNRLTAVQNFRGFLATNDRNGLTGIIQEFVRIDQLDELFAELGILELMEALKLIAGDIETKTSFVVIPNEPYTPIIKDIALDYIATAQKEEIELFHLYPFDKSFKEEAWETEEGLTRTVTLLPTFEEEGTLFIGLSGLVPGNTVNLLFQLAEATADSEIPKARVQWAYLRNNEWVPLKDLFQIIEDNTNGLTRSGIIKIAIPGDITNDENNTLMPAGSYWIKAFARSNTAAVCETINIHTQAALVTYIDTPGLERESMQLAAGKITKLASADARVKKIEQPYKSFGGQPAEVSNRFFLRVSEQLRHKGRAIALCDYEQLVLDQFPEIFLAKCITHTMGLPASRYQRDLAVAPGFVGIAVVPDLNQLQVGDRLAPKAPVSLLDEIKAFLKRKISPFVRLKVMNPRYERVKVCIEVVLRSGRTNTAFYENRLEEDIRNFLAPWNLGQLEKLRFGQKLNRSDFIRFIEKLEYVDYICSFMFFLENTCRDNNLPIIDCSSKTDNLQNVETLEPPTSRSILTAGDITAKVIDRKCEEYDFEIETPTGTCVDGNEEQDLFPICCDQ